MHHFAGQRAPFARSMCTIPAGVFSYKTLTGKKKAAKANPKITALQVELAHVDSEIEKLVEIGRAHV